MDPYRHLTILVLIAVAGVVFAVETARETSFAEDYGVVPSIVVPAFRAVAHGDLNLTTAGPLIRLLTALFLHGGIEHVVLNLVFLWAFGYLTSQFLGQWWALAIFVVCGLCGNIVRSPWRARAFDGDSPHAVRLAGPGDVRSSRGIGRAEGIRRIGAGRSRWWRRRGLAPARRAGAGSEAGAGARTGARRRAGVRREPPIRRARRDGWSPGPRTCRAPTPWSYLVVRPSRARVGERAPRRRPQGARMVSDAGLVGSPPTRVTPWRPDGVSLATLWLVVLSAIRSPRRHAPRCRRHGLGGRGAVPGCGLARIRACSP